MISKKLLGIGPAGISEWTEFTKGGTTSGAILSRTLFSCAAAKKRTLTAIPSPFPADPLPSRAAPWHDGAVETGNAFSAKERKSLS